MAKIEDFFGLNRPQYVASPEVLLSSLAWASVDSGAAGPGKGAVVYRLRVQAATGTGPLETSPARDEARLKALASYVSRSLDQLDDLSVERACSVIAEQLESRSRKQARSVGVLPLTLTAALMQNSSGVLGVANPPNFGAIIEQMFVLGGGDGQVTAAGRLLDLYKSGNQQDSAMEWLAGGIDAMAPPEILELARNANAPACAEVQRPAWLVEVDTPFAWFHRAWTNLCTGGWYEAMPRRRWVDWATCVLRTAVGVGFLYEMSFYHRLVVELAGHATPHEAARRLVRPDFDLLRWDPEQATSKRDVATAITQLCHRGAACRAAVIEWQQLPGFPGTDDALTGEGSLATWIANARAFLATAPAVREQRKAALAAGRSATGNNMLETINGSIVARTGQNGWVDGYSLLRKRGNRYSVVDPGQDWLGVIASLGGNRAGGSSRVSVLLSDLDAMGLRPGYGTVVSYLERAGLARSSHDADDAIEIAAAF